MNIQSILDEDASARNTSIPLIEIEPVLESEVINGTTIVDTPEGPIPEFDLPLESEDGQPAFVIDVHYMKDRGIIIS